MQSVKPFLLTLASVAAGDYRLFPTMSPLVTIEGIITVEDVMEHLIGEEIEDETDFSHTRESNNQVRPGPLEIFSSDFSCFTVMSRCMTVVAQSSA